jgi:hypothetical protein
MITLGPAASGEGPRFARVRDRNIPARPEHIPVDAERQPVVSVGFARRGTGRVGAERERGEGERRVGPEKEAERRANVVLSPEKEAERMANVVLSTEKEAEGRANAGFSVEKSRG